MIRTWTAVSVCALSLIACGDDGGNHVSSGLPANEKLSSLDTGDAQQLCKSLASSFNNVVSDSDRKRIACTVLALPLSVKESSTGQIQADVPKCKSLVTRCLNGETISTEEPAFEVADEFIDEASCTDAKASENLAGCEASVSEFETCANAILGALSGKFDIISCDSLSDPEGIMEMSTDDLELASHPECKQLNSKCPNIDFGGSSDASSSSDSDASSGS
jgi:hypothetical protein